MIDAPAHPDDTAARLLAAARDLFLSAGLAGFSMRKVAAAVGVSATAIYRHYDDKDALIFAVAEEGFRLFGEHLVAGQGAPDALSRLLAAGDGYLSFALEHTDYYRVIFMSDAPCMQRFTDAANTRFQPTFQFLVDRVGQCQAEGQIRPGDPVALAVGVWAHCHGLVSLWIGGHLSSLREQASFVAFFRASVRDHLAGIRA